MRQSGGINAALLQESSVTHCKHYPNGKEQYFMFFIVLIGPGISSERFTGKKILTQQAYYAIDMQPSQGLDVQFIALSSVV